MIFYDGHCGLCHRAVKFVLKHDRPGGLFRFAPLQGATFEAMVPGGQRARLADSIVLLTAEGKTLVESDAFVHILRLLGGGWRILAGILMAVPRPLRDGLYGLIARTRYYIFGRREDWCPAVPPELRARFDP